MSAPKSDPAAATTYSRRDYLLGIASGVAYNVYIAMLGTELVMTWFLTELGASNLLIGLLMPIESGSWCFLQLLLAGYLQRQSRSLPFYRIMALLRVASTGLLAGLVFAVDEVNLLLPIFMFCFTVNSLAAGAAALPFLNIMAKTVPPAKRGMYIGWRRFIGGLLGLLAGVLVKLVLAPGFAPFPDNYALLFLVGFLVTIVLVGTFSLIDEPADAVEPHGVGLGEQLRSMTRLAIQDRAFGRFLAVRVLIAVSACVLPFYTVYARRVLAVPDEAVGTYLIALAAASTIANLIAGLLADRIGSRLLMRLAALTAGGLPLLALLIALLAQSGSGGTLAFAAVFIMVGIHRAAIVIGSSSYVMDYAPAALRPTYLGLGYGLVGLALFLSPLAGALADRFGFGSLFGLAALCGLAASVLSLRMVEPRRSIEAQNPA
jgi:MFS family permease